MKKEAELWNLREQYFRQASLSLDHLPKTLIAPPRHLRGRLPVYVNWAQTTGKDVLIELEATRLFVKHFHPQPKVYYFGIGNPLRLGIDLVWPLLLCDFTELFGVDLKPETDERISCEELFQRFIRAVTLNLSLIPEIDQEKIQFEKLGDWKFSTKFIFQSQKRTVTVFYGFDATKNIPQELAGGYDILFTRRTRTVFWNIGGEVLTVLRSELRENGIVIFAELTPRDEILNETADIALRLGPNFINLTLPEEFLSLESTEDSRERLKEKIYLFFKAT